MASDLHPQRARLEPLDVPQVCEGECDWCGALVPKNRRYCNSSCRVHYNNLLARQAKPIMQLLKVWRGTYGRKGSTGAGMFADMTRRVDAARREDRERKAGFRASQSAK